MAIYTIELEDYVHYMFEDDYTKIYPTYTLFDENHKEELEKKVYEHYRIYELGMETYERWLHEFRTKWNEIIPLANKYFEALSSPLLLKFGNDIRTHHYTLDRDETLNKGTITNTGNYSNSNSNSRVFEDTPYTRVGQTDYATDKTKDTGSSSGNNSNSSVHTVPQASTQDDTIHETYEGVNDMTYADAVKRYTQYIFDVDMWIINQMRDLFMMVY